MDSTSDMPRLSSAAEGLLGMLEDDNLRIQQSNSGEIGQEVAELARELQIRDLYVNSELPDLGCGDLGVENFEPKAIFSKPAYEFDCGVPAGRLTPDVLDLALDMEEDYFVKESPSQEGTQMAPSSSSVPSDEGEEDEVLWDADSPMSPLFSGADDITDDEDFQPEILKEIVNSAGLKMEVEDDGGYEPEIVGEIVRDKNVTGDDDFVPEIVEEVTNVVKTGENEVSDFVEFVNAIPKKDESDDDDDNYSRVWPLATRSYQFPPQSQVFQQRPPLPFQRLPSQMSWHRLPPLPFQQLPFVQLQQPSHLHFQQFPPPPLSLQQPTRRTWYPFNLLQQEPIQNHGK